MAIDGEVLAWAWLAKAKGHSGHTKKSTLAKTFTEKNGCVNLPERTGTDLITGTGPVKVGFCNIYIKYPIIL